MWWLILAIATLEAEAGGITGSSRLTGLLVSAGLADTEH